MQYVTNSNTAQTNLQLEEQALDGCVQRDAERQQPGGGGQQLGAHASAAAEYRDAATAECCRACLPSATAPTAHGNYLFAGFASSTTPFTQSGSTVSYNGANARGAGADQRESEHLDGRYRRHGVHEHSGRQRDVRDSRRRLPTPAPPPSAREPCRTRANGSRTPTRSRSRIPPTYQVTDSGGNVVTSGTYKDGDTISFNGAQVTVNGNPAAGDQFTVSPAGSDERVRALSNLIATLNSTTLNNGQLATADQHRHPADQQLDHELQQRLGLGRRAPECDHDGAVGRADEPDEPARSMSATITNTDYAAATTQLSTEELALQAAQESYASIAKLSLSSTSCSYIPWLNYVSLVLRSSVTHSTVSPIAAHRFKLRMQRRYRG